ncbi:hypothetical protein FOS14_19630 [Skermania sp. ID1734]|uniref:hypothetical protein n=1 Tax=Skermania sp. ID1734 TaxID=2597516 RepID=UPI00117D5130|nr:hypothetical protein [Skermania sp. ID1734]TSD94854.1 hypothetical protein FOS14_19630 [Skermania sp. ID1734]
MKRTARAVTMAAAAIAAGALWGTGAASAAPIAAPDPNHGITVEIPAGEWWNCQALSFAWPLVGYAPAYYQYALGPTTLRFDQFPPGSDVWISCSGTGLPVVYYGPIVRAS